MLQTLIVNCNLEVTEVMNNNKKLIRHSVKQSVNINNIVHELSAFIYVKASKSLSISMIERVYYAM